MRWILKKSYGEVSVSYNTLLSGIQHRCNFRYEDIEILEKIIKMLKEIKENEMV